MTRSSDDTRLDRALRSLDGLSVGDAFGECFFSIGTDPLLWQMYLTTRKLPEFNWRWTDDTAMAVSIVEILARHGRIDQDDLAQTFAKRYADEPRRGYGGMAHGILHSIGAGEPWRNASGSVYNGTGSMGNGGAMRVAPLGAFFADDIAHLVEQAKLSAEVTHAHPEGQAGAIAVALATAFAANHPSVSATDARRPFFEFILDRTPASQTRAGIVAASNLPPDTEVSRAISLLGNGTRVVATDTVPFCLWCAAKHYGDFVEAMWTTVSGGGDIDTNCAIVGGILAMTKPNGAPPANWLARRESLPS
jgi:ADP-ribosylglycohydrolase